MPLSPAPHRVAPRGFPSVVVMLLALLTGFSLSQAFRTITSVLAQGLQAEFGLGADSLGAFAGLFGLSFGVAQLLMGVALDLYGLRRTVVMTFPLATCGAVLSALAPNYGWLLVGQALIGIGCSPAFLACTLFISRHFPTERFALYSGIAMGAGGMGLLFTGTPLAWVIQHWGWRTGFWLLAALCVISWLLIYTLVHEPSIADSDTSTRAPETWKGGFGRFVKLFTLPHTWGIVLMGMSCYASFLTLRGLWLGPMLIQRFSFSLVDAGNVALMVSLLSMFTPAVFGRMDRGPERRRVMIANVSLMMAALFLLQAFVQESTLSVVLILLMGLLSGYSVLQHADVRSSYPKELVGRALSLYTMSMFLGIALMQWFTGQVAGWADQCGLETFEAVMICIAVWLAMASIAFRFMPKSPQLTQTGA